MSGAAVRPGQRLLERENVLLLLVPVGHVTGAATEAKQRFVVVRCGGVLGVLVEADLALGQHTVEVGPRPAVVRGQTAPP